MFVSIWLTVYLLIHCVRLLGSLSTYLFRPSLSTLLNAVLYLRCLFNWLIYLAFYPYILSFRHLSMCLSVSVCLFFLLSARQYDFLPLYV